MSRTNSKSSSCALTKKADEEIRKRIRKRERKRKMQAEEELYTMYENGEGLEIDLNGFLFRNPDDINEALSEYLLYANEHDVQKYKIYIVNPVLAVNIHLTLAVISEFIAANEKPFLVFMCVDVAQKVEFGKVISTYRGTRVGGVLQLVDKHEYSPIDSKEATEDFGTFNKNWPVVNATAKGMGNLRDPLHRVALRFTVNTNSMLDIKNLVKNYQEAKYTFDSEFRSKCGLYICDDIPANHFMLKAILLEISGAFIKLDDWKCITLENFRLDMSLSLLHCKNLHTVMIRWLNPNRDDAIPNEQACTGKHSSVKHLHLMVGDPRPSAELPGRFVSNIPDEKPEGDAIVYRGMETWFIEHAATSPNMKCFTLIDARRFGFTHSYYDPEYSHQYMHLFSKLANRVLLTNKESKPLWVVPHLRLHLPTVMFSYGAWLASYEMPNLQGFLVAYTVFEAYRLLRSVLKDSIVRRVQDANGKRDLMEMEKDDEDLKQCGCD